MEIRQYRDSDYEQVAELWKVCFSGTLRPIDSREHLKQMTEKNPGMFLVAEKDGKIIGSIFATYNGRQAVLNRLAVLPEEQKNGIGNMLFDKLLEILEKYKPIEFLTHANPEPHVVKLCEKKGFEKSKAVYMKKKVY